MRLRMRQQGSRCGGGGRGIGQIDFFGLGHDDKSVCIYEVYILKYI